MSSASAGLRLLAPSRRGRRTGGLRGAPGRLSRRARRPPAQGFHGSAALRVREAPWLPGSGPAYEDWYAVEDWAALGRLNEAAVRGARAEPHDAVAARAGAGAGAVYGLVSGPPVLAARRASWLAKPPGPIARRSTRSSRGRAGRCGCARWCSGRRRSTPCAPTSRSCCRSRRARSRPRPCDHPRDGPRAGGAGRAGPRRAGPRRRRRDPRAERHRRRAGGARAARRDRRGPRSRARPAPARPGRAARPSGPSGRGGAARGAVGAHRDARRRRAAADLPQRPRRRRRSRARRRGATGRGAARSRTASCTAAARST